MKKSLLMLAAGVALSANVFSADAADLYLRGGVNNWGTTDQFETTDDDNYTLHLDKLSGEFKIATADWEVYNFGAGENAVVTPGVACTIYNGSNTNLTVADGLTDVTVNFTLSTATLLINAGGAEEITYTYALHGALAGSTWADVALTEGESGVWTGSFVAGQAAGEFGVKKLNGTIQAAWIAGDGAQTIDAENTTATLVENGVNIAVNMTANLTYNVTLNVNEMTVTIVADEEVPPVPVTYPETLYIIGEANGNGWFTNVGVEMENKGEGIFVAEGVQLDGYFSFTEALAEEEANWDGLGQRYGAAADGSELELDAPLAFGKGDSAFKVFEAGTYDLLVDFDNMTVTLLKAGAVGVEAIEVEAGEAVYYNLCGVRVANPENGIFVKVVDGKATKVVK